MSLALRFIKTNHKESQKANIEKVLKRFKMKDCTPTIAPILKGDTFSKNQCPQNDFRARKNEEHIVCIYSK